MAPHPSDAIKTLTSSVHQQVLRPAGFKKRRHSFRRSEEAGLVQLVEFQMSPKRIGTEPYDFESDENGRARGAGYGMFTVNLGIYIQEVRDASDFAQFDDPKHPDSAQCHVRSRIGALMPGLPASEDWWWSLENLDIAVSGVLAALEDLALPWLERLRTREGIVRTIDSGDIELFGTPERGQQVAELVRQVLT